MTQVIAKVTLEKFVHALNHARRRFPLVDANCHHESTVAIKVADEFRRRYTQTLAQTMSTTQLRHKRNLAEFEAKHCHLMLVFNGAVVEGGYCVLSGELMALWNVSKGKGDWLMQHAINDGAVHLDHFDVPVLCDLYERHGFREVLREPNDPKQRPQGGPDVIFRRREV